MADRYWVGGTGSWDATAGTKWSLTDGGTGGEAVPVGTDVVYLTAASGAVTITISAASCQSLICDGFTGTITGSGNIDLSGTGGNPSTFYLTLSTGMTLDSTASGPTFTFSGQWPWYTHEVMSRGKTLRSITLNQTQTIKLLDNLSVNALSLSNGVFNTNNYELTTNTIQVSTFGALNLGSSIVNCTTSFTMTSSYSQTVGTSSIRITGTGSFAGGGKTYYELQLNGTSHTISGVNTFTNLIRQGTASKTDVWVPPTEFQTITGTLTIAGNSAVNRLYVWSGTRGVSRTITAPNVSFTNCDFEDIVYQKAIPNNTFVDSSTNNFTITKVGSPLETTVSPFNDGSSGSAHLPTSSDYLTLASNAAFDQNSGDWTVEGFFKMTSYPDATNGTNLYDGNFFYFLKLQIVKVGTAYVVRVDQSSVGVKITGTTALLPGRWYHVAMVRSGSNVLLFLDGIQEGSTATGITYTSASNTITLGRRTDTNNPFLGYLSNFRVVKGTAVYTNPFTPPATKLTAITNTSFLMTVDDIDLTRATGTSLGDCWGNNGITFSTPVYRYWVGALSAGQVANWSDGTKWSDSSGGSAGASVPLPQDFAILDSLSGGGNVLIDLPRIGNVDFINSSTGRRLGLSGLIIYGDFKGNIGDNNGFSGVNLHGRGNHSILGAGYNNGGTLTIASIWGTYTAVGGISIATGNTLTLSSGIFNSNNYNVTVGKFTSSNSNSRVLMLGSSQWNLTSTATIWDLATSTNLVFSSGTSIIITSNTSGTTRTFAGGSQSYNHFRVGTSGSTTGTAVTAISGGANTFDTISSVKTVAYTIRLNAGTTNTVSNWLAGGASGALMTLLTSNPISQATLAKAGGGTITVDYANIRDINATPGSTWYATNSIDSGNNTGWSITAAPVSTSSTFLFGSNF